MGKPVVKQMAGKTVKVKVTLELEVPDKNYAEQGMIQLISENLINSATMHCCQFASHWAVEENQEMVDHFKQWSTIIHDSNKTLKVEF